MVFKTPGEVDLMDEANRIVHEVLDRMSREVAPGVTTKSLDTMAEQHIREAGGVPAFLNYRGFPGTLCTSVNDVIVHGIPNEIPLAEGEIVGIDCGVLYKGYYGDAARTFAVGEISGEAERLMRTTRESLEKAVEAIAPGRFLSDIGHAVEAHVCKEGYAVVREFVGHGIGTKLHEEPQVPNFGNPGRGLRLKTGLVLAVEPMVNVGTAEVKIDSDGWTARTGDGSLSAHFEYSIAVTDSGARVLGQMPIAA